MFDCEKHEQTWADDVCVFCLCEQIDTLAGFIISDVEGEPSANEGAIGCSIRIIKELQEENRVLREALRKYGGLACDFTAPETYVRAVRDIAIKALEGREE